MESANMTFQEETLRLRAESKKLRQKNAQVIRSNKHLTERVAALEEIQRQLITENQKLQKENKQYLAKQEEQEKALESLKLIVEELRRILFKQKKTKKKEAGDGDSNNSDTSEGQTGAAEGKKRKKAKRTAASYRRPAPEETDVTDCFEHRLTNCPDCGTTLIQIKQIIRYIEDLVDLTQLAKVIKKIEKHSIWSGYCTNCKKRKIAQGISPQVSILGEQVKRFIAYQIIIMRQSFEQVKCFLRDTANFAISDGDIVQSLDEQAEDLKPEKERIVQKIRGAPGSHYDETVWKVQKGGQGNYCWIKRPTVGEEAIFLFGRSRGIDNAKELKGKADEQVGISDDYGAYKNLFTKHQLCMSHPQRKLRDLKESGELTEVKHLECQKTYGTFSQLYKTLEATLATTYDKQAWQKEKKEYIAEMKMLAKLTGEEPEKLRKIKEGLSRNVENYFTCLDQPGIPADNNKAERGVRHVVLKRKSSYGSKSQKGADTMGILCTTLLSAWWNKPVNFFVAYQQMLTA